MPLTCLRRMLRRWKTPLLTETRPCFLPGLTLNRKTTRGQCARLLMVALKQAKVALESGPEVPRDESTILELCRLVAVDVDDTERRAQTLAAMRARALHASCPTLRMKHLRARVWRLKSVASPGPRGWRNTHVQAMARTRGGMQLLMQWVMLWARAKATPDLAETWTAALVHPVDWRCANATWRASQTQTSPHCLLGGTHEAC